MMSCEEYDKAIEELLREGRRYQFSWRRFNPITLWRWGRLLNRTEQLMNERDAYYPLSD